MKIVETEGKYRVHRKIVLEVGDLVVAAYIGNPNKVYTVTRVTQKHAYASDDKFTRIADFKDPEYYTFKHLNPDKYERLWMVRFYHITKEDLKALRRKNRKEQKDRFQMTLRTIREDMEARRKALAAGKYYPHPSLTP